MTLGYQITLSCTLSCCNTCSLEARRRLACDILGLYGSRKVISYSVTERRPWVRNAHSFLGFLKDDSLFFPCSFVLGSLLTFYFFINKCSYHLSTFLSGVAMSLLPCTTDAKSFQNPSRFPAHLRAPCNSWNTACSGLCIRKSPNRKLLCVCYCLLALLN